MDLKFHILISILLVVLQLSVMQSRSVEKENPHSRRPARKSVEELKKSKLERDRMGIKDSCPAVAAIYPCSCYSEVEGLYIYCSVIGSGDQLKSIFNQPFPSNYIYYFELNDFIMAQMPDDVFADKQVEQITVKCDTGKLNSISPNAFRNSAAVTRYLDIQNCDFATLDMSFLNDFISLTEIWSTYNGIQRLTGMQYLPSLDSFRFYEPTLESLFSFEYLPSLTYLEIENGQLRSSDFDTLSTYSPNVNFISITGGNLTDYPQGFRDLSLLDRVYISNNPIIRLTSGSLHIASSPFSIDFSYTDLQVIEPGAFGDNLGNTYINFFTSKLQTFDEDVFRSLLESMMNGSGNLSLQGSIFNCGCDMAWFIRDHSELLRFVNGGTCANGTRFEDLDSNGFSLCP